MSGYLIKQIQLTNHSVNFQVDKKSLIDVWKVDEVRKVDAAASGRLMRRNHLREDDVRTVMNHDKEIVHRRV